MRHTMKRKYGLLGSGSFRAYCEQSTREGVLGKGGFVADLKNADAFRR